MSALLDEWDWYVPENDEDDPGYQIGLVYYDGWGYTPNDLRTLIERLDDLIVAAEDAARTA
jgi:hypothetical protein